jgi:hypothetical protein
MSNIAGRLVLAGTTVAALVACSSATAPEPIAFENALSFEREDGSAITIDDTAFVWCGPWEPGEVPEPTVHVSVGGLERGWSLRAVLSDITIGQALTFPNTFIWNEPRNADLFVLDTPNELSTQTDGSSGQIVFHELDCRSAGALHFSITATIGSEFGDGPSINVQGSFRGPVGESPR